MTDYRTDLEHDLGRIGPATFVFDDVIRRRDRKRRNQRIAAGVVGIGMFAAAILFVTTGGALDQTQTEVVPAGGGSTEPALTGPTSYPSADFVGVPPEGAEPSSPEEGKLVDRFHEIHAGWVYVYADGRVISWSEGIPASPDPEGFPGSPKPAGFREQRLTLEGVELVRSGDLTPEELFLRPGKVPASAWEDSTMRPYVPSRYAVCLGDLDGLELDQFLRFLPAAAGDLLRGREQVFDVGMPGGYARSECFGITTEEARALDEILTDTGFYRGATAPGRGYERWSPDMAADPTRVVYAAFRPILPDGTFANQLS
jgi:hypothetical protein